jgi:flagellar biosynthesis protein FlhF
MMLQTFRGRTLEEARRAAQAALGPDVVILTTRSVRRAGVAGFFGGSDVEISAAPPEREPAPAPTPPKPRPLFNEAAYSDAKGRNDNDISTLRSEVRQELRSIQGTMSRAALVPSSVETMLAGLVAAVDRLAEPELPRGGPVARVLRDVGLEGKAAQLVVKALKGSSGAPLDDRVRDAVADLVRVAPWPLAGTGPELIALVGPSGVGKTTTAAKIAAHARLEQHRSVTFITCDVCRVGAYAQLERFASLLGAGIEVAQDAAELRRKIEEADADVVIVDTPGSIRHGTDGPEAALGGLAARPVKVRPGSVARQRDILLCMPASLRATDAERFAKAFASAGPTALVITKLDETRSPVGLIHASVASKLPVSILCFGQRVPEDVAPATTGAILDYLLPRGAAKLRSAS